MTDQQTGSTELTPEQKATLENGRVADLDAAAKKAAGAKDTEQQAKDQAAIDAEKKKADEEAAKKAEEEAAARDDGKWKEEWVSTGNEHADSAIELMKSAGVTPVEGNAIFEDAIKSQDLTKVKWDVLESRIGKAAANLVKTGIETYYNTEVKAQTEVRDYAYEQVGGEQGWNTIKAWANKQEATDPAFAKEVNEWRNALKLGGFAAKAAINALKDAYEKAPGNGTIKKPTLERGTATPSASAVGDPLSKRGYFEAMQKAGGDRASEAVKAALRARRQAGMQQGI